MTEKEMVNYLLSTDCYKDETSSLSLYYEKEMMNTEKTIPIKELVERFIEIDKEFNGEPWNIKQILSNINIIMPLEDR